MKMGNKKKSSKKTARNDDHGNEVPPDLNIRSVSVTQDNFKFGDSVEIKQENDIKQEPLSIGDLIDVPASTYRDATHVPDFNEHDDGYDCDFSSLDEVKIEVKKECDDKKEDGSKTNADSGEDAAENHSDQPMNDEVDVVASGSIDIAHNMNEREGHALGTPLKSHNCNICEYSAQFKSKLNRHMIKHTGVKPHACNFCPKRFVRNEHLRAHMKVHVEESLFHCLGCLKGFDVKDEKNEHETSCKVRRYECHLCKESFGSMKTNMIRHMRVHSGKRPFECKQCFKQFTEKSSLKKHMELHAGPRSFRCSKCRMGFSRQEVRNKHEETCNRPKFECDICGKSFGLNKSNLIRHMRTHSGETPFECERCSKQFKHKGHLNRHLMLHTNKLPFKCSICRQGFSKQTQCKAHERGCNRRCYECHLCKKFIGSRKTNLKSHMIYHSGDKPFQCEVCQIKFTLKSNLKRHMNHKHN